MTDIFSIRGQRAAVTGAAMGIGFAIAKRFVESGADIVLVDANEGALKAAQDRLAPGPGKTVALVVDISSASAGDAIVQKAGTEFGGIDILVNNAGIYPQVPLLKMTTEMLDRVLGVNLRGLVLASKAVGNELVRAGRGGSIVNIGSVDSVHPSMVGLAAYDASKGGVLSFTKNLALELAPYQVRVNAILPGGIATEGVAAPAQGRGMTAAQMNDITEGFLKTKIPMHRMGKPDEIAAVAAFLASPAASYMTGSAMVVDGGMLLT